MKRTVITIVAALWAWPAPASAQEWSPAQQQVIDQVKRCNDGWAESIARKDFDRFKTACPETADAVFWYGGERPVTYGGPKGLWSTSASSGATVSWGDLRPVAVQVDGDTTLIYYSVVWTVKPAEGEPRQNPSRRLTVFRRSGGRWLMAGGTVAAM